MATPRIYLLEANPKAGYNCQMCRMVTRRSKFFWKGLMTGDELTICRECAYKEEFGTKGMKQAKKDRVLEQKEIN